MGIREAMKDKSKLGTILAAAAVVGIVIYIARNAASGSALPSTKAYYSTDDGQTQFVESVDHLAPFDHDGKQAYRVWMFSSDGGKTKFPGYLERYTPAAKARIESELQDFRSGKSHVPPSVGPADTEVKKIGAGNPWVSRANAIEGQNIIRVQGGSNSNVEMELPE